MKIEFVISKVRAHRGALEAWTGTELGEFLRTVKHSRLHFARGISIFTLGSRLLLGPRNTGISPQLVTTTTAIAAVMLTGVADASGEAGVTVCSRMLEASLPHRENAALQFRIELVNRGHVDTEKEYAAGDITYDLRAVEAGGGRAVAAAACIVNKDGAVIAMLFERRLISSLSLIKQNRR